MTISCITYLAPIWRWIIDGLFLVLLMALFFYLPLRLKTRRSWCIALFVIGGVLILFTQWVVVKDYQCYQSFQPELVHDFNQRVTTKEQARDLLRDYILQEYFPAYSPEKESYGLYVQTKEERKTHIEEGVQQEGNTFSIYYFQWKFILHEDGKLYQKWKGD